MSHVFVSYARRDRAFVDRLAAALEGRGVELWIDREDLAGGAAWEASISEAVRSSDAVIAVLSPSAAGSEYVPRELSLADKYDRPVVPVVLEPWDAVRSELVHRLDFQLAGIQHVDFAQRPFEAGVEEVLRALHRPDQPPAAAMPAKAPRGWSRRLVLATAAGSAIAVLAALLRRRRGDAPPPVAGDWVAPVRYDWGTEMTERFRLAVDGDVVSGTASFLGVPRGIVDGRIDGDTVTFRTRIEAGPGSPAFVNAYRGRLDGDGIRFVLQDDRGTPPATFLARRVAASGTP
jgi:catechol 2,3-dioxygenase-like lactoylglutathione lyase family enzyme